ncbi:hypothetical protein Xmlh_05880 [Xanthomonas axonopodis pv. melhusii]|uniref:Uncharacterized protein n=1 Tax=Xanthomonas axonopodis pv. melhusii TaxID=487834 RepID=A0A1T1P9V1_9XANT|nr:hypothetical protein Xmlh_05880 [Xanthomonas axonopodis pv. melhusii]
MSYHKIRARQIAAAKYGVGSQSYSLNFSINVKWQLGGADVNTSIFSISVIEVIPAAIIHNNFCHWKCDCSLGVQNPRRYLPSDHKFFCQRYTKIYGAILQQI